MGTESMKLDKPYSDIFEWLYRDVYEKGNEYIDIQMEDNAPAGCGVESVKLLRECAGYLETWGRQHWRCLPPITIKDIKGGFRINITTEFQSIYHGWLGQRG